MSDFVIVTDTASDLPKEKLTEWDVRSIDMTFRLENGEKEYVEDDMPVKEFYDRMRAGSVFKTAAINSESAKDVFEEILKEGKDVLYIGFSTGLSVSYNVGRMACEELAEQYPDRKLLHIDSLCASAGEGLLVYFAVRRKKKGASIEEILAYLEEIRPQLCHWFTVDDLVYLRRGGRISATAALAGTVLGIKPVLHVDDEGHLINVSKVRGRGNSIKAIVAKYRELALDPVNGVYFISHGDCPEDAKALEKLIYDEFGNKCTLTCDIGPVIGSHSGPGTLAVFFLGKTR